MAELDFYCACGAVRGVLRGPSPRTGIRYVCHCDDCQAFAHFLGEPRRWLDAHGGTDVFQTPASRFEITLGAEHLACVQVTRRPLLRWYAACCRTPIANTYGSGKASFLSLILAGFDPQGCGRLMGPPAGHAWTKFGTGDLRHVRQLNIPAMLLRIGGRLVGARLSGDYRRNPFFDPATGAPVAAPRRLTPDERAALDRQALEPAGP
jgi:hypothetical protein